MTNNAVLYLVPHFAVLKNSSKGSDPDPDIDDFKSLMGTFLSKDKFLVK